MFASRGLHQLVRGDGFAELVAGLGIIGCDFEGRHGVPNGLPGGTAAGCLEHAGHVAEVVAPFQPAAGRKAHLLDHDVGLENGALAHLAGDDSGGVPRGVPAVVVLFNDEDVDVSVLRVPGKQDDDIGHMPVADPALVAVDDPMVPVAAGLGLQGN
jgi:hypothetical protein